MAILIDLATNLFNGLLGKTFFFHFSALFGGGV